MVTEKARERLHAADLGAELPAEEFEATALKVGVATLKFADLDHLGGRLTSSTSTASRASRAKTGPYLGFTRRCGAKSLLRKAADDESVPRAA